jgi:hypothetical protein
MTRLRPQTSLNLPQIGADIKTMSDEAAIMLVIWNSVRPISLPMGDRIGNKTEKPIPTITREAKRVRLAYFKGKSCTVFLRYVR